MKKFIFIFASILALNANVYAAEDLNVTLDNVNSEVLTLQEKLEAKKAEKAAKKAERKAKEAEAKAKADELKNNLKNLKNSFSVK